MPNVFNQQTWPIAPLASHTITMPGAVGHPQAAARNGDRIRFEAAGTPDATLTFEINAGDQIEHPESAIVQAGPLAYGTSRFNWTYTYQEPQKLWAVQSSHYYRTQDSAYQLSGGPVPVGATETPIPLAYILGDNVRFDVVGGQLVSNFAWGRALNVRLDIGGLMTAGANNVEITLHCGIRLGGAIFILEIDDIFPFQTSRSGSWNFRLATHAQLIPNAIGNTISAVAWHDPGATMTAEVQQAILIVEGS